jgi:hypothetical protein
VIDVDVGAGALRERFAVYGRYYRADLGGRHLELRSHLEIFERQVTWPQAARAPADLVAVMMNPGGSRPLAELDGQGWAPAMPDRTQYQLMKLALLAQAAGRPIHHIRVINLSDLRTPKSAELFATLATLPDDHHSIFSASRVAELHQALGHSRRSVLLRAWGMSSQLSALAQKAVAATSDRRVLGLTDNDLLYRHPLPQRADFQQRWLSDMASQLALLTSPP